MSMTSRIIRGLDISGRVSVSVTSLFILEIYQFFLIIITLWCLFYCYWIISVSKYSPLFRIAIISEDDLVKLLFFNVLNDCRFIFLENLFTINFTSSSCISLLRKVYNPFVSICFVNARSWDFPPAIFHYSLLKPFYYFHHYDTGKHL